MAELAEQLLTVGSVRIVRFVEAEIVPHGYQRPVRLVEIDANAGARNWLLRMRHGNPQKQPEKRGPDQAQHQGMPRDALFADPLVLAHGPPAKSVRCYHLWFTRSPCRESSSIDSGLRSDTTSASEADSLETDAVLATRRAMHAS